MLNRLAADAIILDAGSGSKALALVDQNPNLDLNLLDLSLPDLGGLEILISLHDRQPEIQVVVLPGSEQVSDIIAAIDAGARGYIPKSSSSHVLFAALRLVFAGTGTSTMGRMVSVAARISYNPDGSMCTEQCRRDAAHSSRQTHHVFASYTHQWRFIMSPT